MWLLCVIGLATSLFYLIPHSRINSSVMALLPKAQITDVPVDIIDGFQQRLDRQLVWLIKPTDKDNLQPLNWWVEQLNHLDFIEPVSGQLDEQFQQQWGKFAFEHRFVLLDPITKQRLIDNNQFTWILGLLYSPFDGVNTKELRHDPLLLTRSIQLSQLQNSPALKLNHGWLNNQDEQGHTWYLIHAELKRSSYNMSESHSSVTALNQLVQQLQQQWPETEVLQRGVLFYSDYASEQAQHDISTIGLASLVGIILLMIIVFRSTRPIWLTLLSISIGTLFGLVAVLVVFGEIHIITLVMSTSVVGLSIDYALHYLCERMLYGKQETALQSLAKLRSTLTLALLTSMSAYLLLLIAPFPGLQQLAVFAACGLTGAFLTVICWYPYLVKRLPVRQHIGQAIIQGWLNIWQHLAVQSIAVLCALIFIAFGVSQLKIDDDIASLQALPEVLKQQEQQIGQITQQSNDQKWFIVYGDTAEQTLQRLEAFQPALQTAKQLNLFEQYQLLPLPSLQTQRENIALIQAKEPAIVQTLQQMGLPITETNITDVNLLLVTPEKWLHSVNSQGWRLLWLSLENGKSAALIPITNIHHLEATKQLATKYAGVHWVDRRTEFTDLFATYRVHLQQLLAIAVTIICLSFIYRNRNHGLVMALKSTLPTLLSVGSALAVLGITGQTLNLFAMLALILVLGIGIDYSLFLSNPKGKPASALLAVSMAAMTTLLTFGLLALSHTNAIVGFGLVLASGIFTAFLFSPLVLTKKTPPGTKI